MPAEKSFRYEDVLGTPNDPHRASARQQIYTSLRGTQQNLDLLGNAPLVAISAPTGTMVSCNMLAERLSEAVMNELKKREIIGLTSPIVGVSDGVLNGHPNMGDSLHSRNMMANQIAYGADQYSPDGHFGLFACDKTGPAEVMAYASLQHASDSRLGSVPSVMMYAGSTVPGFCHLAEDRKKHLDAKLREAGIEEPTHDIVTGFKTEGPTNAGLMTGEEMEETHRHTVEEIGACQGMYTANTMSVALEVLGMTAPGSSQQITTDSRIFDMAGRTVDCMKTCIEEGITPNQIITIASIRNSLAVVNALGGSTNAVLHFKALGNRLGIELDNDFFREIRANTPLVGNLKPFGEGDMVDYIRNGDHKLLLRRMIEANMIDGSLPTVTGKSLGDNVEEIEDREPTGKTTLFDFNEPIRKEGNLAILDGNLGDHAVMKVTADAEKSFKGKAICFNSEQEAIDGILNGDVKNGMVVVIRFVGPKAAAMPEMLTPTSALKTAEGLDQVSLISDGRFSGGSYGAVVGHISPEALDGGVIGKIQDGDEIEIDSDKGTIDVNGVDLDSRESAEWTDQRETFHPTGQFSSMMTSSEIGADYIKIK